MPPRYLVSHSGHYKCRSTLDISHSGQKIGTHSAEEEVQIFVKARDVIMIVITVLIISTLGLIIVSGMCLRYAPKR